MSCSPKAAPVDGALAPLPALEAQRPAATEFFRGLWPLALLLNGAFGCTGRTKTLYADASSQLEFPGHFPAARRKIIHRRWTLLPNLQPARLSLDAAQDHYILLGVKTGVELVAWGRRRQDGGDAHAPPYHPV